MVSRTACGSDSSGTSSANDAKGRVRIGSSTSERIFQLTEFKEISSTEIYQSWLIRFGSSPVGLGHRRGFWLLRDRKLIDCQSLTTRSVPAYRLNRFSRKNPTSVEPYSRASSTERLEGAPT